MQLEIYRLTKPQNKIFKASPTLGLKTYFESQMFSNPTKIRPKSWTQTQIYSTSKPKTNQRATHPTCATDVKGKRIMEATRRTEENEARAEEAQREELTSPHTIREADSWALDPVALSN